MGNALAALLPVVASAFFLVLVWRLNAPALPRHAAEGEAEGTGALPRHQRAEDAVEPWRRLDDQCRQETTHAIGRDTIQRALAGLAEVSR